ncbi:MAG: hypothetical protein WA431_00545, partial [Candidatus Cybelea sp.]
MKLPLYGPMNSSTGDKAQITALSLQQLRGLMLADLAYTIKSSSDANRYANFTAWRGRYEALRACWNSTLATAPSPSPSPTTSPSGGPPSSNSTGSGNQGGGSPSGGSGHHHDAAKATDDQFQIAMRQTRVADVPPGNSSAVQMMPAKKPAVTPTPSPTPLSATTKPTCDDVFSSVLSDYASRASKAQAEVTNWNQTVLVKNNSFVAAHNNEIATRNAQNKQHNEQHPAEAQLPYATPQPTQSPLTQLSDRQAQFALFWSATHIDATDLSGYLSSSPSLLGQLINENVGSYATDNYVRNLFLSTASISFVNSLQAGAGGGLIPQPDWFTFAKSLASDCASITAASSAISCLNDFGTIETAYASARLMREACAWDKHVLLPTFSDVYYWARRSGPYDPANPNAPKGLPTPPDLKGSIVINTPAPAEGQTVFEPLDLSSPVNVTAGPDDDLRPFTQDA